MAIVALQQNILTDTNVQTFLNSIKRVSKSSKLAAGSPEISQYLSILPQICFPNTHGQVPVESLD